MAPFARGYLTPDASRLSCLKDAKENLRDQFGFSDEDQWRGHIARPKTAFSAGRPVPHVYTGVIKNISKVRRLGFILCGETFKMYGRDILVEPRELEKLEENQKVTFMVKLQEGRAMGYNLSPLKERPAQPSGKDLGSKLWELGQQWRNLRRQAPEPRAGPKLRTELTVSCSIPKACENELNMF